MKLYIKDIQIKKLTGHEFSKKIASDCTQVYRFKINDLGWPALNWDFTNFTQRFGDTVVRPLIDLPRSGAFNKAQNEFEHEMTLAEFINIITTNRHTIGYLGYLRPHELSETLANDHNFTQLTGNLSDDTDTRLWIGSQNTHSGLHSDLKDNIFIQIYGTKILYLAPFQDTRYLYPFLDNITNSYLDPENICLKIHPKSQKARFTKLVLKAGDAVFIPKGCWHCFISLEPSISINHWFGSPISSATYIQLIIKQGPKYIMSNLRDLLHYFIKRKHVDQNFFFSPPSNTQRFLSLLRYGDFSYENDPVNNKENKKEKNNE